MHWKPRLPRTRWSRWTSTHCRSTLRPPVPSEVLEKLETLDVETLTPIEALNFLYELKKTLKGSLNG